MHMGFVTILGGAQTDFKRNFRKVANVKPPASRADSSEKFVVAQGFRGRGNELEEEFSAAFPDEEPHPGDGWDVDDGADEVTVHYTCGKQGHGRTTVRKETPRLVQVDTQGIRNGQPFSFAYEARKGGGC